MAEGRWSPSAERAMRGRAKRAGWRGGRRVRRARSAAVGVRPPRSAPGISPPAPSGRFLQCPVHTPQLLGTPPSWVRRCCCTHSPRGSPIAGRCTRRSARRPSYFLANSSDIGCRCRCTHPPTVGANWDSPDSARTNRQDCRDRGRRRDRREELGS
jgi:hypothetical protein